MWPQTTMCLEKEKGLFLLLFFFGLIHFTETRTDLLVTLKVPPYFRLMPMRSIISGMEPANMAWSRGERGSQLKKDKKAKLMLGSVVLLLIHDEGARKKKSMQ